MTQEQSQVGTTVVDVEPSRFDLLLLAIPLALLTGIVAAPLFSVPFIRTIVVGAIAAASLIGYGLYAVS